MNRDFDVLALLEEKLRREVEHEELCAAITDFHVVHGHFPTLRQVALELGAEPDVEAADMHAAGPAGGFPAHLTLTIKSVSPPRLRVANTPTHRHLQHEEVGTPKTSDATPTALAAEPVFFGPSRSLQTASPAGLRFHDRLLLHSPSLRSNPSTAGSPSRAGLHAPGSAMASPFRGVLTPTALLQQQREGQPGTPPSWRRELQWPAPPEEAAALTLSVQHTPSRLALQAGHEGEDLDAASSDSEADGCDVHTDEKAAPPVQGAMAFRPFVPGLNLLGLKKKSPQARVRDHRLGSGGGRADARRAAGGSHDRRGGRIQLEQANACCYWGPAR